MAAISYSGPLSAVPSKGQLLGECAKFQIDILKTEGLVRVYTHRQTDTDIRYTHRHTDCQTDITKSTQLHLVCFHVELLYLPLCA